MGDAHIDRDTHFMRQALAEGEQGLGVTSPNPPVGAVIVQGNEILGTGWHRKAGGPHAEVEAIRDAQSRHGAETLRGATIYVTLEPCSTEGKTPPCVSAIREAGLARVVAGCRDPNPRHAGAGLNMLRHAGIEVREGVLEERARDLIRFFAKWITTGVPWVIAKTAMTIDGRTTLPPDRGRWITSEESREDVQRLRRQIDAILVGGETLRVDDPRLNLRGHWAEGREQPLRVILTAMREISGDYEVFTDEHAHRTEVHHGALLSSVLEKLGARGVTSVLLESGGRLFSHGIAANLIDEAVFYIAPIVGGGEKRVMPGDGAMARLHGMTVERFGPDIRVCGRVGRSDE